MPSDLTERLAAKLENETNYVGIPGLILVNRVRDWLPLLLSEPELVAGLAPEAKREVLVALLRELPDAVSCEVVNEWHQSHLASSSNGNANCRAPSEAR